MFKNYSALLAYFLLIINNLAAQPQISLSNFSTDNASLTDDNLIVAIANCKDSRLFLVCQRGKIYICDSTGTRNTTPFLSLTGLVSSSGSEKGLLGLAFHPNYKTNGYFYVNYTLQAGGHTQIARYSVSPTDSNVADPSSAQVLMRIYQPYTNHNGGTLNFGPDGYLYVGMGDGGSGGDPENRAQNKDSLLGKMLRIDVDNPAAPLNYGIPADNPFVGAPGRDEIWAYGVRNPWKWSFDRVSGDMWMGDVGQNAVEEVNFQPASSQGGENYGWRCYEGNSAYNTAGCSPQNTMTAPIATYTHSFGYSITGGYIYRGARYGNMYGWYIYTDYGSGNVWATKKMPNGTFNTVSIATGLMASCVAFGEDYRGELYASIYSSSNNIIKKISDLTNCLPTAAIAEQPDTIGLCDTLDGIFLHAIYHPENTYQWLKDGIQISGATNANLHILSGGAYSVIVTNPSACSDTSDVKTIILDTPVSPVIGASDSVFCITNPVITLSPVPSGGVFNSINGLSGYDFDPSLSGPGTFSLEYAFTSELGCTYWAYDTLNIDACTGIQSVLKESDIQLYPNPANESINIRFNRNTDENIFISVYSVSGEEVLNKSFNTSRNSDYLNINTSDLKSGLYLIGIKTEKLSVFKKVAIQH